MFRIEELIDITSDHNRRPSSERRPAAISQTSRVATSESPPRLPTSVPSVSELAASPSATFFSHMCQSSLAASQYPYQMIRWPPICSPFATVIPSNSAAAAAAAAAAATAYVHGYLGDSHVLHRTDDFQGED